MISSYITRTLISWTKAHKFDNRILTEMEKDTENKLKLTNSTHLSAKEELSKVMG